MRRKIEINEEDVIEDVADHEAKTGGATVNATPDTDDNAPSTVPEETAAYITALQAEMEDVRARLEDTEKRLLYAQAEFQNVLRRRDEQSRADQKYANGEIIKSLLPILDNFDRALKAAEQTRSFDALIAGVSGTLKQLLTFLEKSGVTPIEAVGKEFDPTYHEAIGHAEESDYPANTVAEVVQRGYIMHDRVLRPALVKVAGG
jgi:molecular chaperone GrpE